MFLRIPSVIILLMLFLVLLSSAGCWNRREPENLASIVMLGFDYDKEQKLYKVIAEIATPSQEGGHGNGSYILESRGRTVFEAIRKMERLSPRELFWAHSEVVIFSENIISQGILPGLDFLSRERQARLTNRPLCTDENLIDIFQMELPIFPTAGDSLSEHINAQELTESIIPPGDFRRLLHIMTRPGMNVIIPRIKLIRELEGGNGEGESEDETEGMDEENDESSESENNENRSKMAEISGGAAFRGEQIAGWLEPEHMRGWFWITGEVFRATEVLPCPTCNGAISIEVFTSSNNFEVTVDRDKPRIKISVEVEGRIQDMDCRGCELFGNPEDMAMLDRRLAESIRQTVKLSLDRAQELETDIFGFGFWLYRKDTDTWKRVEHEWDELFAQSSFEIEVEAKIKRTGLVSKPIRVR